MAPADLPWAERHRPQHLGELVGNTEQIRKLAEWLRDWDDVVLKGKVKEVKEDPSTAWMKFKPPPENINARAALVSGPPGIGKTTTACLVARCMGKYSVKEFNASDARSKKAMEAMKGSISGNKTLKFGGETALERSVIIMDECDGMTASEGMQALIEMIKVTKNPIICICNDRQDQAIRNLAPNCLDIKFKKPDNKVVAKRVQSIFKAEGKPVDLHLVQSIVEACGQDIRQVINQVQFFGAAGAFSRGGQKDLSISMSPFDACSKLLAKSEASKPIPFDRKMDWFYIDADLVPLMVQENYLRANERDPRAEDVECLERMAQASELIATGNSMSDDWGLTNSAAALGTVYPACLAASGADIRPIFPTWLTNKGKTTKASRFAQEVHSKIRKHTSTSAKGFVTSGYHDVLHRRLLPPLLVGDAKEGAALLDGLGLTREFFTDQAPALRAPLHLEDKYKTVNGAAKTQLLHELNALQKAKQPQKRAGEVSSMRPAKRRKGAGDDADDEQTGDVDDAQAQAEAKKKAPKKKAKKDDSSGSLGSWVKRPVAKEQSATAEKKNEGPMLILKYIEGHTLAVRRKVHMSDILAERWRNF